MFPEVLKYSAEFVHPMDYFESMILHSLILSLQELLGDDGVLLFPSHPTPAPYHGQPLFRAFNFVYTAVINVLLFPSTQCPLGLGSEGLPLGIQVRRESHSYILV